jgi:alkylhydroperoxidase family enzyme
MSFRDREARLSPQEPSEWGEEARRVLGATANPLAILRTLAHQPRLLAPFLGWAAALAGRGALPRRDSELLALRTAWNCRSTYEWGHHAVYARSAGLSDEEIERVAISPAASAWSAHDRVLLTAADELHARQQLSDAAWSALRAQSSDAQLVEIPLVVGHYTMLSMLANASGVPLEPGLPALPAGPGG